MKIKDLIQYWRYVSFSFRGRINRTCWWLHFLFTFPFIYLAGGYLYYEGDTVTTIFDIIVLLFALILYYTYLPAQVKRFHDTNRSGWNLLWALIPIIGALYVLTVCGFLKGTEGNNKYGVNPTGTEDDNKAGVSPSKNDWLKKLIPYLLGWVIASVILGLSLGTRGGDEEILVVWLIIFLILVANPIVLPKIWRFVLARIGEIAKAIRGTD